MKDFIFVSDFDGTITDIDFDEILLNGVLKNKETELLELWNSGNITVSNFLKTVYSSVNCTEDELREEILKINIDNSLNDFINFTRENNGDFLIVSSGSSYYIKILLEYFKINKIDVISNIAIFKNRGLHLLFDKKSPIYSEEFGINKKKIVEELKNKAKKIYYAGDGRSDLEAALISDKVFSKGELSKSLDSLGVENIKFKKFNNIKDHLLNS